LYLAHENLFFSQYDSLIILTMKGSNLFAFSINPHVVNNSHSI